MAKYSVHKPGPVGAYLLIGSLLAGCQSSGSGSVSLDEARNMAAEFDRPAYTAPPRTANDLILLAGIPVVAGHPRATALRGDATSVPVRRRYLVPRGGAFSLGALIKKPAGGRGFRGSG